MADAWSKWWDIAWYLLSADVTLCRCLCSVACWGKSDGWTALLSAVLLRSLQSGMHPAQRACHYRRLRRRCRFQRSVNTVARRLEGRCDGKGVDPLDCCLWSQYSTACSLTTVKGCPLRRLKSDAANCHHYYHIMCWRRYRPILHLLLLLLLLLFYWCVFHHWISLWPRADGAKLWRSECQVLTLSWRAFSMLLATFCSVRTATAHFRQDPVYHALSVQYCRSNGEHLASVLYTCHGASSCSQCGHGRKGQNTLGAACAVLPVTRLSPHPRASN